VAAADRSAAAGAFQGGSGVSGSRAQTSAVLDDGGVVRVLAETADTGLSIGEGLLRIAAVRSRSETTLGATDAEPVTHSQLVIEGATVAGHPVTIDADGVHAADHEVAAPIGRGVSSDNELLGQAGITATVVPTGRPGSANALVITSRQATPAPNNPKGTLVLRVGGASSEIVVGSADLPPAGPAAEGGPPGEQSSAPLLDTPDATGPSPSRSADRVAAGSLADDPPPAGVSGAGLSADLSAEGPSVSAAPLGASPEPTAARPARLRAGAAAGVRPALVVPDLATTGALFSLLAMGGLGLLLATRLHRLKVMKVRG